MKSRNSLKSKLLSSFNITWVASLKNAFKEGSVVYLVLKNYSRPLISIIMAPSNSMSSRNQLETSSLTLRMLIFRPFSHALMLITMELFRLPNL